MKMNFKLLTLVIAIFWGGNHICAQNQFSNEIDSQLSSFEKKADTYFLTEDYKILKQRISAFYSYEKINLSDNQNFNRRLYAAYVSKFLNRSFSEFKGTKWNTDTMNFIHTEIERLITEGTRDGWFEKNSDSGKRMDKLKKIFTDYDKINRFIVSTKKFSYTEFSVSDTFPIIVVQKFINQRDKYFNKMDYPYTTNCTRLNEELKSVTKILFRTHVKYLEQKLDKLSECYKETKTTTEGIDTALYASQPIYRELYYEVMKNQLRGLKKRDSQNNFFYKECDVIKEFDRLVKKLDEQNDKAYDYFESKFSNENE